MVGAGYAGQALLKALTENPGNHYAIVGLIDDDPDKVGQFFEDVPVLGNHERLLEVARSHRVTEIILANNGKIHRALFQALLDCQEKGLDIVRMPSLYEQITGQVPVRHLESDWVITSFAESVCLNDLSRAARRLLDISCAIVGLAFFALIFPWVALSVRFRSRGPLFYSQIRVGRGGRPFKLYKFRTMLAGAETDGRARWASDRDTRITCIGAFLRRTHLDEVPQFWNVLKGEMSVVGPRPERPEFFSVLEKDIPFYRARLPVKPGLTGWAQINYGYGGSVKDALVKLQYDLYYIKHRSIWLDLLILLRTFGVIVKFKGT